MISQEEHLVEIRLRINKFPISEKSKLGLIAAIEALYAVKAKPAIKLMNTPEYVGKGFLDGDN